MPRRPRRAPPPGLIALAIWVATSALVDPVVHRAGACGGPESRERTIEVVRDGGREDRGLPPPELVELRALPQAAPDAAGGCGHACPPPTEVRGHALVFAELPSNVLAVQPVDEPGPVKYHVASRLEDGRFVFDFDGAFFDRGEFVVWGLTDAGERTPRLFIEPVILEAGEPSG